MKVSATRQLEALFDAGTLSGMPDGALLERFVSSRDGVAFEAIVTRHGPMVFNVCRRMLLQQSDAEDAFQATFLILVRKAGTLRDRQRLGPWLYGVAHRVASRARAQAAGRRAREREQPAEAVVECSVDLEQRELVAVLDEELARLPEKYRAAIVLCDLEGETYEQAARQLDCALGTLKSRLASARQRLRSRLVRRGFAPSAAMAASLASGSARAALPARLAETTVTAAVRCIVGPAALTGGSSASVSILTEGVLMTMFLSRLTKLGVILLAVGTCAASLAVLAQQTTESRYDKPIRQLEERLQMLKQLRDSEAARKHFEDTTAARLQELGAEIERDVVVVNLAGTKVADKDLSSLSVFPRLQTLYLHHTSTSDAGLASLKGFRSLIHLDLFDTRVTDTGLEHLAEWMPHLEELELSDTNITDVSLGYFKGLTHLRRLDVRKTKVTEAGVSDLRRALPGAEIRY